MRFNNIRQFFEEPGNYEEVRKICGWYFHNREEADDVCQNIVVKLLTHRNRDNFPKERENLLRFIGGVVYNYRLDALRRKKKQSPMVDETHAVDVSTDLPPSGDEKMEKLNELVQSRSDLFTEEQMKLWHLMYLNEHIHVMSMLLDKTPNAIYQMRLKIIEKIRTHFKLSDLL